MKVKLLLPILLSAFLLFSNTSCKKEFGDAAPGVAPAGSNANLTMETVEGPKKDPCGGFDWKVKFTLKETSKKGGWIVQQLTRDASIFTCPGGIVEHTKLTYWEAWHVMPGTKGDSATLAGLYNFDDEFREPSHPSTYGTVTFTGEVKFFEDLDLPATFIRNNKATYAHSLPSTTAKPDFWSDKETAPHSLTTTWNCCDGNSITSLETTPTVENKTIAVIKIDSSKLDNTGKMILQIPDWTTGYYTEASQQLVNIARQVQNTTSPTGLRNSIIKFENAVAGTTNALGQESKIYLLLRVMYQLPQSMNINQVQVFGSWLHPDIGKNNSTFNLAWPVFATQSPSGLQVSVANFTGFDGRGYNAVGEYDYFNTNFQQRNL